MIWSYVFLFGGTILTIWLLRMAWAVWTISPMEQMRLQERYERRKQNKRLLRILKGKAP